MIRHWEKDVWYWEHKAMQTRCPTCLSLPGEKCHNQHADRHYSQPKEYRELTHKARIKEAKLNASV